MVTLFRGPEGSSVTVVVDRRLPWPYLVKERIVIRLTRAAAGQNGGNSSGEADTVTSLDSISTGRENGRRDSLLARATEEAGRRASASPVPGEITERSRSSLRGSSNGPGWASPLSAAGGPGGGTIALGNSTGGECTTAGTASPAGGPSPGPRPCKHALAWVVDSEQGAPLPNQVNNVLEKGAESVPPRPMAAWEMVLCGELMTVTADFA